MANLDDRLNEVAARVADGEAFDWDVAESSAPDATARALMRHLRAVAAIGHLHALRFESSGHASGPSAGHFPDDEVGEAGSTWGSLRILAELGRGRFGIVYRAWEPILEREVALKLLRRRENPVSEDDALVIDEGRLMARIRHSNVVTIYGAQRISGRTGIWMELVDGQTLEAELRASGPLPASEVARVGGDLCRALAAVHQAGLVHRDVKAQNVLRDGNGRIVLGDFGTGRELDDVEKEPAIAGTPVYLAPEIFQRAPATPQSDLYSLGTLLFHLATGTYPVGGRSSREVRDAHTAGLRESLLAIRPDFDASLTLVIERALERDPDRRFESAREMEAALADSAVPRRSTRSRRWQAGVGLLIALGTGVVAWRATDESRREPAGRSAGALAMPVNGSQSQRQLSDDPTLAGPGGPSPDGRFLSFAWDGDLAIHDFATGQPRKVTTENRLPDEYSGDVETSRFSGDGASLFYVWYPSPTGDSADGMPPRPELRQIAVGGGRSRLLWRAPEGSYLTLQHWSGNDAVILGVLTYDKKPGEIVAIANPGGALEFRFPLAYVNDAPFTATLSPDAKYVAFDQRNDAGISSVYVVRTDDAGGAPVVVIADGVNNLAPLWTRDGRHLLFLSDRSGDVGLWAQRVDGMRADGPPVGIEPSLGVSYPMGLTDTGSYVYRRQFGRRDVYVATLDDQFRTLVGEPIRLTAERDAATGTSDWSHDGRHIVFFRRRDFRRSLVIRDVGTGHEREFSDGLDGVARPRWEPGDESILFKGLYRDRGGLHRLDVRTGRITTVKGPGLGLYELMPDGSAIIYTSKRRKFVRYDLRTRRERLLYEAEGFINGLAISTTGDRLAYTELIGDSRFVRVIDIADPRVVREVLRVPGKEGLHVFAWTPDDQSLLVYRSGRKTADNGVWSIHAATGTGWPIGLRVEAFQEARLSPSGRALSFDLGSPLQEPWAIENVLSRLK